MKIFPEALPGEENSPSQRLSSHLAEITPEINWENGYNFQIKSPPILSQNRLRRKILCTPSFNSLDVTVQGLPSRSFDTCVHTDKLQPWRSLSAIGPHLPSQLGKNILEGIFLDKHQVLKWQTHYDNNEEILLTPLQAFTPFHVWWWLKRERTQVKVGGVKIRRRE